MEVIDHTVSLERKISKISIQIMNKLQLKRVYLFAVRQQSSRALSMTVPGFTFKTCHYFFITAREQKCTYFSLRWSENVTSASVKAHVARTRTMAWQCYTAKFTR